MRLGLRFDSQQCAANLAVNGRDLVCVQREVENYRQYCPGQDSAIALGDAKRMHAAIGEAIRLVELECQREEEIAHGGRIPTKTQIEEFGLLAANVGALETAIRETFAKPTQPETSEEDRRLLAWARAKQEKLRKERLRASRARVRARKAVR